MRLATIVPELREQWSAYLFIIFVVFVHDDIYGDLGYALPVDRRHELRWESVGVSAYLSFKGPDETIRALDLHIVVPTEQRLLLVKA